MNEHVGFLTCPNCSAAWGDGQLACPYCSHTTPPEALRPYAPWAWYAAAAVLVALWLIDRNFGGHAWTAVSGWMNGPQ